MKIQLPYAKSHITLDFPDRTVVLQGPAIPALPNPDAAIRAALQKPIAAPPLLELIHQKKPASVVITLSDITRPVPNEAIITALLETLNAAGIPDSSVTLLIATGMHRPSTPEEIEIMLGTSLPNRCTVLDHRANDPQTLTKICDDPPVAVNTLYKNADLKIVTGLIEPHFMAGFSGGRKGVCPALVDLQTVQRFHGHATMADPHSVEGRLDGNPCHEISHRIAHLVGVDFLVNVAITHDRQIAGIYAGDLDEAFLKGCHDVATWTSAQVDEPFDFVVTSAGGFPLDKNFYQTIKGMCTALPALKKNAPLLMLSACDEVGEPDFVKLYDRFGNDWRAFLNHIETSGDTDKDQWEYQMQTRVLQHIGIENLILANDGLSPQTQRKIATTPAPGTNAQTSEGTGKTSGRTSGGGGGDAIARAQHFIDTWDRANPNARLAVIPQGPYTMIPTSAMVGT